MTFVSSRILLILWIFFCFQASSFASPNNACPSPDLFLKQKTNAKNYQHAFDCNPQNPMTPLAWWVAHGNALDAGDTQSAQNFLRLIAKHSQNTALKKLASQNLDRLKTEFPSH